ncbi:MAG TPA: hypothetical protein VJ600_09140 [Holophagaceae bacterium]|nr:hypothetical protein [Holophagaceae bacterium]
MKLSIPKLLLGLLIPLGIGCVPQSFIKAPLVLPPSTTGRIYAPRPATLSVTVKDERPAGAFLGGGILGPNSDKGEGIFLGYQTETPEQLRQHLEGSAKEAIAAFAFTAGPAYSLELRLKDARIDMYRYSGFSPMNCIAYIHMETSIKGPDGQEKTKTFKLTYYENTTPAMSMKEVVKEAVSRIYHQAALEAVMTTLQEQFPGAAEPASLANVMAVLKTTTNDDSAREVVFLLGLTGKEDPATKDAVVSLFRTSPSQRIREGALEAVGMMGIASQTEDIQSLLAGKVKIGAWDKDDTEEVWYMLKTLHLLGVPDLKARIPVSDKLSGGARLKTLVEFMDSGKIPPLTDSEKASADKLRQNTK